MSFTRTDYIRGKPTGPFTSQQTMSFTRILCSDNVSNRLCQNSLFREISIWITHWSFTAPLCTISLIQRYLISIFFDLTWNTGLSDNFTQLQLSLCIQVASIWRSNKSDSSFLSHTASQLAEKAVTYSTFCCTQCHTGFLPTKRRDHT